MRRLQRDARPSGTAGRIADERARTFGCGADERMLVGDAIPEFGTAN
jgi:hypothetical protein